MKSLNNRPKSRNSVTRTSTPLLLQNRPFSTSKNYFNNGCKSPIFRSTKKSNSKERSNSVESLNESIHKLYSDCKNEMNLIQTLDEESSDHSVKVPSNLSKKKKHLLKIKNKFESYRYRKKEPNLEEKTAKIMQRPTTSQAIIKYRERREKLNQEIGRSHRQFQTSKSVKSLHNIHREPNNYEFERLMEKYTSVKFKKDENSQEREETWITSSYPMAQKKEKCHFINRKISIKRNSLPKMVDEQTTPMPTKLPIGEPIILSDIETKLLYQAKCRDLNIPEVFGQYQKFRNNFLSLCQKRTFTYQGAQIGSLSAKVIGIIMINNDNFCKYDLSNNLFRDEGVIHIAKALNKSEVISLNLSTNAMTDIGLIAIIEALICNETVIDLDISSRQENGKNRNKFSISSLTLLDPLLKTNKFLYHLNLSGVLLREPGTLILSKIFISGDLELRTLNLSQNDINSIESCKNLKNIVKYSTKLEKLDISKNRLKDIGIEIICQAFYSSNEKYIENGDKKQQKSQILSELIVTFCEITVLGFQSILHHTVNARNLIKLNLDQNDFSKNITPNNIDAVANNLISNGGIQELSLNNCKIGEQLAVKIAYAIKYNHNLRKLNLSRNSIRDKGACSLANALMHQKQLKYYLSELNLSQNEISQEGGLFFAKLLKNSRNIKKLNLSHNHLTETNAIQFISELQNNKNLILLDITGNQFQIKQILEIKKAIKRNRIQAEKSQIPKFQLDKFLLENGNPTEMNHKTKQDIFVTQSNLFKLQKFMENDEKYSKFEERNLTEIRKKLVDIFELQQQKLQDINSSSLVQNLAEKTVREQYSFIDDLEQELDKLLFKNRSQEKKLNLLKIQLQQKREYNKNQLESILKERQEKLLDMHEAKLKYQELQEKIKSGNIYSPRVRKNKSKLKMKKTKKL